ncbi:TIGR03084 family metal-binding protein [soil metagenome]
MAVDFGNLLAELRAESTILRGFLSRLREDQWDQPTPADGWAIRDQVSHLAYFDDVARLALTDTHAFAQTADSLLAKGACFPDVVAEEMRSIGYVELFDWYVMARDALLSTFEGDDPRRRIPWFGPDMSVASSATGRLMETWAHGQDIYDTLGVSHPFSPGLKSVAHLGVSTFAWAFHVNELPVPTEPVRVELQPPYGDVSWVWGPADADNRVSGPAEDFVLTVTQRRHWTQTALTVHGPVATQWMSIAQAYAGDRGKGNDPKATAS